MTSEPADSTAGLTPDEAFATLGHETRLSILLALWEEYEPMSGDNAVRYSELLRRVEIPDSGKFNYHLDKLTGHFIEAVDDGYELRRAGQKLVRTVIAGTGLEATTLTPTALNVSCHRCDEGRVRISYRNETLYLTCTECEGFLSTEEVPSGALTFWDFDSAGLANRSPTEIHAAGAVTLRGRRGMMGAGVCPDCSGTIESTLRICEEHNAKPGTLCPDCGTRDSARVRYICTVCKNWLGVPIQNAFINHPAVVSFYYDHGVDMRMDADDIENFPNLWELVWEQDHAIVSTDPVRIRMTFPYEGDQLDLVVDEALDVVAMNE